MFFDPENKITKLCHQGMMAEVNPQAAKAFFQNEDETPLEKMIAAHYYARQQDNLEGTLLWNTEAQQQTLLIENKEELMGFFPSLHLNLGKSLEDLGRIKEASKHYVLAQKYIPYLKEDGYGTMIQKGIQAALERVAV
jgi:hypothetical protein